MNWYNSISVKIVLCVVGMILVVNGALAYLYLTIQKENLNITVLRTASQLSETIKKSIQNDMLENRKEAAYKIMETIGRQEGIEKVRIYSNEGKILFSSDNTEVGRMVDKRAEACYGCHSEALPLERLESSVRSRTFFAADRDESRGERHRILGIINPLYNEEGCSSAKCHAHPESMKVLGVIDVTMSLADLDAQMAKARGQVLLVSLVSIVAICIIVALILFHFIERPVKELVLGTKRISGGDLNQFIPVATNDEMGHLASSFNQMTRDLQKAREEIQEGIRNLEHKVRADEGSRRPSPSFCIRRNWLRSGGWRPPWRTRSTTADRRLHVYPAHGRKIEQGPFRRRMSKSTRDTSIRCTGKSRGRPRSSRTCSISRGRRRRFASPWTSPRWSRNLFR
jgi:two-component system NtrC family sensor kinase